MTLKDYYCRGKIGFLSPGNVSPDSDNISCNVHDIRHRPDHASLSSSVRLVLNEFDPYFDYYASLHVVTLAQQHGLYYALFNNPPNCPPSDLSQICHDNQGYFFWHDIRTWYPYGRNVAGTSQVGLQLTGAFSYLFINSVLHIPVSYYDYIVFFPVMIGSLTIIPLYYLVKKITNSAGGIFAALIFAVSPPILERGNLGWFKSEPLSLFASCIGAYFFLSMYSFQDDCYERSSPKSCDSWHNVRLFDDRSGEVETNLS